MSETGTHLHPIFERVISRLEKEKRLKQTARAIWLFGLSGSGKSTLAVALERSLADQGVTTYLLDGDNLRTGLNRGLGFSDSDRSEGLRRAAEVARLFVQAGIVTICSFITPLRSQRETARQILGREDFLPVYVKASFETCAKRDPKGLYARAARGDLAQFTGRDSAFEEPLAEESVFVIDTDALSPAESSTRLLEHVCARIHR